MHALHSQNGHKQQTVKTNSKQDETQCNTKHSNARKQREREVYCPRYNNAAVKLTASKHKVEGCQKGIKPILTGYPL